MASIAYTGAAQVETTDFRYVKWVGLTKGGKPVQIELENGFCRSNPNWAFAEKNDTTAEAEFEGAYTDEKLAAGDLTEPWKLTGDDITAGNDEILLGAGKFYLGTTSEDAVPVGLTRGGGSFVVEREFREINADGDPGLVKGRIVKDMARPKLKLVALQWLTKVDKLYSCIKTTT